MPDGVTVRAQTDSGDGSAMFDLAVFPAGVAPEQPRLPSDEPVVRRDAPQVNGQDAYWLSVDGTGPRAAVDRLRFRDADGRWMEVKATGLKGADRQQLPLQMAAGVVPGAFRVPLPVSMSALPPETEVAGVTLLRPVSGGSGSGGSGSGGWSASLSFRNKAYGFATVEVGPGERGSDPNGSAPRSSNDGLATVTTSQKCASGNGLHWCVRLIKVSSGDAAAADPADWLSLVVPHGMDESGWTTDVLPQS
ncbi:hypothetical protein [Kitasatospora sp. CB01950]|uniref:hypothetical protein n=1 Tax=Kitasatospora sp. CB01950 TaxID=1703930 RepID=UPI000938CE94|nr:hypothetical protein [Kitasatospora sp. CB01950]OKJ17347.1 hypothetical protein AMK19_04595 [Kitasatospora sp. CB01950]